MGELIQKELKKAHEGREYWLWLMETYHIENGKYVILIPYPCTRDAYLSLLFLEDFIKEKDIKSVIILSTDVIIKNVAFLFSDKIEDVVIIDEKRKEAILKFYCLYEFSNCFVIASLTQPKGRKGTGLLQTKKFCYAEIFAVIVYGLDEVEKREAPYIENQSEKIWMEKYKENIWEIA